MSILAAAAGMLTGPRSTVQVVGDVYLDIIAKVDDLPTWDGDTSIRSPIETVAGGSALNTAVQLSALLRSRRQRAQARPFRRCVLHSRIGSDLYGDLVAARLREAKVELSGRRAGGQGVCICLSGQRDRSFISYKAAPPSSCTVSGLPCPPSPSCPCCLMSLYSAPASQRVAPPYGSGYRR